MTTKSFVKQIKMVQNKENLLVQLSVGDLQQLIQEAVKEEMTKITDVIKLNTKTSEKDSEQLLTRDDVKKLLNVSYTTLFLWNRDGKLPAQKIGKRVYYQRSNIMDKLKVA